MHSHDHTNADRGAQAHLTQLQAATVLLQSLRYVTHQQICLGFRKLSVVHPDLALPTTLLQRRHGVV